MGEVDHICAIRKYALHVLRYSNTYREVLVVQDREDSGGSGGGEGRGGGCQGEGVEAVSTPPGE